jgi:formylmethanofuran dehydrogenase subunit B
VGSKWFADRNATPEVNFDETAKVKKLLESSRSPLITGVANLTTESQQLAVRVADRYFAGIDTDWSNAGRGSMAAFQRYGKVTATLGEIANRSDLVVLWYCDPMMTHPRFVSRFLRQPGMPKKHLIVVDEKENSTCEFADEFISLSADRASEFVLDLRKSIGQNEPSKLTSQLLDSSYGCVVLGKPSGADAAFGIATDQWFQLVRSLNDHTRFVMSSLRNDRNGIGANGILTSMSGFPDSVRFTEEGPLWNGLEYSTANVVARRECDLLVVCDLGVGEPFESRLDGPTIEWLKTIPVIALSDFPANKYSTVDVHVPAGTPGWSKAGDFVRMDDVPIPMQAVSGVELTAIGDLFHGLLGDGDNSLGV